jgi:hypothetical protein
MSVFFAEAVCFLFTSLCFFPESLLFFVESLLFFVELFCLLLASLSFLELLSQGLKF